MRKKSSQSNESKSGNWMDTYGDLVTLLLCFFVLLFSFSTIDAAKWEALVKSFSGASGVISEGSPGASMPLYESPIARPNQGDDWQETDPSVPVPPHDGVIPVPLDPSPTPKPSPTPTITPAGKAPSPPKTPPSETTSTTQPQETTTAPTTAKPTPVPTTSPPTPTPVPAAVLDGLYHSLNQYFGNQSVSVHYDGSNITVRLVASVIFESGSDRLLPEAEGILQGAVAIIDQYLNEIRIMRTEGHTDNRFENENEANDAFQLAAARAVRVNRFLLNRSAIDEQKASVIGHGSNQPVADNNTDEGRNQNNRVDIVLSN